MKLTSTLTLTAATLVISLGLSACSSLLPKNDPTRYYALRATSSKAIATSKAIVNIGPVTIPGYLDHKEIVTAGSNHDLTMAEFSIWAESMEGAISRVVAENVARLLNNPQVAPDDVADSNDDYKVSLLIRRFEMGPDHQVRLESSYNIKPAPGSDRSSKYNSCIITTKVSQNDHYAAIADAMSRALADLSTSIARDLAALDQKDRNKQSSTP